MCVCGVATPLWAQALGHGAISVRIYDYDDTKTDQIQRAQRDISRTFAGAGVPLDWRGVVVPADIEAGRAEWPTDGVTTLTIVILKDGNRLTRKEPRDVAGFAPITRGKGGSVAYVLGGRVRDIVEVGGAQTYEVLAGVITHEMTHLLLPDRGHGPRGVLRAHWTPVEFRNEDLRRFSLDEASALRDKVSAPGRGGARTAD